jgi:SAM-dependent methyltransferase
MTPERKLIDEQEIQKQQGEIAAWRRIARAKGADFMRGEELATDLEPYRDKILVDVGCGPRPFAERFPARFAYMVDCCMLGYQEEGLLQPETPKKVSCIDAMAEKLPFADDSVDILFAINMLDHTFRPEAVMAEFRRVLRPGGMLHLHVDIGGKPNECEPVVFTEADIDRLVGGLNVIFRERADSSNVTRDHMMMVIAALPGDAGATERPERFEGVLRSPDSGTALSLEDEALVSREGLRYPKVGEVWDLRPRA